MTNPTTPPSHSRVCPQAEHDADWAANYACANRHQCWEPCGELGKSGAHARQSPFPAARVYTVSNPSGQA